MKLKTTAKLLMPAAAVLSPALPLVLYFSGNWYSFFHSYSLGMAFGLASCSYFLNALVLSGRIRLFDRLFGHDRVLIFHGWMSLAALTFAAAHFFFKYYYTFTLGVQTLLGAGAFLVFASVIAVTVIFMIDGLPTRFGPIRRLRALVAGRRWLDYSCLKRFHNFASLAALLASVHVLLASSTLEITLRTWVMAAWAGAAIAVYLYHKVIRLAVLRSRAQAVREVLRLAEDVVELKITGGRRALAGWKAGQFAYFRFLSKTCGFEEHPFTVASAPGAETLSIVVKKLGDYTARLGGVEPGTKVLTDGPYGVFTPRKEEFPHLFIAGGIGITPFLSIVADWDRLGLAGPLTLLWSMRRRTDLIYGGFLDEVCRRHPLFRFVPVFSREEPGKRRIDAEMLDTAIPLPDRRKVSVYLCGPDAFRKAVTERLIALGVPGGRVHFERFSS